MRTRRLPFLWARYLFDCQGRELRVLDTPPEIDGKLTVVHRHGDGMCLGRAESVSQRFVVRHARLALQEHVKDARAGLREPAFGEVKGFMPPAVSL